MTKMAKLTFNQCWSAVFLTTVAWGAPMPLAGLTHDLYMQLLAGLCKVSFVMALLLSCRFSAQFLQTIPPFLSQG